MKSYAGIGSRDTPQDILDRMFSIAVSLSKDYILRSGGADGADWAFENGCISGGGNKEIFLPWKGFNGNPSVHHQLLDKHLEHAERFHPAWRNLSYYAKRTMARNSQQVLGSDLNDPVEFVICWTKDGKASGGTGQAIRIANHHGIRVINLKTEEFNETTTNST